MPSLAGGVGATAAITNLLARRTERLDRCIDETGVEHLVRRCGDGQVAEVSVQFGGELLDFRVEPAVEAPKVFGIKVADHDLEKILVQLGDLGVHDRGSLIWILKNPDE